jgi:hypothetical protein
MSRLLRPIVGGSILVVLAAAPASYAVSARTWHVAAAGRGDACTKSHPCGIVSAFNQAQSGDTILIGPGSYGSVAGPLTQTLGDGNRALTVVGQGKKKPTIYSAAAVQGILLGGDGPSSVSWLRIVHSGSGPAVIFDGFADRIDVLALSGNACQFSGTMRNSVCWSRQGTGLFEGGGATLTNDDFISDASCGIYASGYQTDLVVNIHNTLVSGGNNCDVEGQTGGAPEGTVTFDVDHSQYVHEVTMGNVTFNDSADIVSAPSFANRDGGDLREAAGAPSIDHGSAAAKPGALDLAGNPRVLGHAVDIGAYEHLLAPSLAHFSVTKRTKHSITTTVRVNPRGLLTAVRLAASRHHRTILLDPKNAGAGTKAKRLTLQLGDLPRHATYKVQAIATNVGGTTAANPVTAKTK